MAFRGKKVYGASRMECCPLCGAHALMKNKQGIPVCVDHKDFSIELKCACGSWLDPKEGKWGTFFVCIHCGAISWQKAMAMNNLE
jgi:hypothetical protein